MKTTCRKIPVYKSGNALDRFASDGQAAGKVQGLAGAAGGLLDSVMPMTMGNATDLESPEAQRMASTNQQANALSSSISSQAMKMGPAGMVIGGAMKVGQLGSNLLNKAATDKDGLVKEGAGNALAAGASDMLNPIKHLGNAFGNLKNQDLSTGQKIMGFVPGLSGVVSQAASRKARARLAVSRDQQAANAAASQTVAAYGRNGMKIPVFGKGGAVAARATAPAPAGRVVPVFRKGGAVVLGGQLHREGGKLGKGNPVVNPGGGRKIAETERNELLLSLEQTQKLEGLIAAGDMIALGRYVQQVVTQETKNNSHDFKL